LKVPASVELRPVSKLRPVASRQRSRLLS
jgi:hypothetical protein